MENSKLHLMLILGLVLLVVSLVTACDEGVTTFEPELPTTPSNTTSTPSPSSSEPSLPTTPSQSTPTPSKQPPTPAEFEIISFDIEQPQVVRGETTNITAVVKNTGGSEGIYTAILTIDGANTHTKEVTIPPSSTQEIIFSLEEEALGIYQIGIESLTLNLEVLTGEVELKYDDGSKEGFTGIGRSPGTGYLIDFSPPSTPFIVTGVRIFGKTSFDRNLEYTVEIWDKKRKIIYSASYPHNNFSPSPKWVEIEIPEIVIDEFFYVHVFTHCPGMETMVIGSDMSSENEHSLQTEEWKIVKNKNRRGPWEIQNWMIRAVGNLTAESTTVSS